jgi:hypothetical protein
MSGATNCRVFQGDRAGIAIKYHLRAIAISLHISSKLQKIREGYVVQIWPRGGRVRCVLEAISVMSQLK